VIWLADEKQISVKHWLLKYYRETTAAERRNLERQPLNYRG